MEQERRRFFRIDDTIGVVYRVLSDEELSKVEEKVEPPMDIFGLLVKFDTQLERSLGQLRIKQPLVSEVLDILNNKFNAIVNQLEVDNHLVRRMAQKVGEVNISACGMAFVCDEALVAEQVLSLELALKPSNLHVYTHARVVTCDPMNTINRIDDSDTNEGYYLRVDFCGMSDTDQEVLIQHIVKRQGNIIRMDRDGQS